MSIKALIRNITPPIILKLWRRRQQSKSYPELNTKNWSMIQKLLLQVEFDSDLLHMVNDYLQSSDFQNTSKYWRYLNLKNLKQIENNGIQNYGVDVARNYFTITDFNDEMISNLEKLDSQPTPIDIFKKHEGFTLSESVKHNVVIALIWSYLSNNNLVDQFSQLGSTGYLFGGHPFHNVEGKVVTLDKLSSVLEFHNIEDFMLPDSVCLEIGAGSGRTAETMLTLVPGIHYIIADLPPASFIAMLRLRKAFPDLKILYVDSKIDIENICSSLETWDVVFCLPSMLQYLTSKFIHMTIAIDCLHEMSDSSRFQFSQIVKNKSKYYYVKINKETLIPLDNILLGSNDFESYFFDRSWKVIAERDAVFPSNYSELLFEI
jgi:putative sugar O-methyltransferase